MFSDGNGKIITGDATKRMETDGIFKEDIALKSLAPLYKSFIVKSLKESTEAIKVDNAVVTANISKKQIINVSKLTKKTEKKT